MVTTSITALDEDPTRSRVDSGTVARSEDFLYHLYRGSTMLMEDRVVEAKGELEQALALQPQDAKSQDLLAGVYFRLGLYPRAIEIWRGLVQMHARDATLRVNLALALFKTGQADEALRHVHAALEVQPDHDRAWGYLGLIHWRLGKFGEARDAFLRGGQASMARRMEEALGATSPGTISAPTDQEIEDREQEAMRSAAEEAIEEIEKERLALETASAADGRPHGAWRSFEIGEEPMPRMPRDTRVPPVDAPPRLDLLVESWQVRPPEGAAMVVGPGGDLVIESSRDVYLRLDRLTMLRGNLETSPVPRRTRGKELSEPLGADEPILRWHGPVVAMVAPVEGGRFVAVTLDDDVLYVRESLLFGFDDRVGYESANLPLAGEPVTMTQLHGSGTAVLRLDGIPKGVRVGEGTDVRVAPAMLIGWTGRLFPSAAPVVSPSDDAAPPLLFRGDGVVLVR